jgi:hypothetical protein
VRTLAIALFALSGCIDEYRGSELQIDFSPATPVQASLFSAVVPGQLPAGVHFTLYAFDEMPSAGTTVIGRLFKVQDFEIHRIVDLQSPCFIDVGDHVEFPGIHVSEYANAWKAKYKITDIANPPSDVTQDQLIDVATAIQREENVVRMAGAEGPKVISSASNRGYEALAASCTDSNGIPPPNCVEPDANQRRLDKCQAAWTADPSYFEGTDRVLTKPLDGKAYGMVNGTNPVNLAPIGGSAFFVDESLEGFDGFAIYWSYDDFDGDGKPDYPPSVPQSERTDLGTLYLFGRPEKPTRGVIHVHMTSLVDAAVNADLAIFANLYDDDVHF